MAASGNKTILMGYRSPAISNLWLYDLANSVDPKLVSSHNAFSAQGVPVHSIPSALTARGVPVHTQAELATYKHVTLGCPSISTFLRVLKNFLVLSSL